MYKYATPSPSSYFFRIVSRCALLLALLSVPVFTFAQYGSGLFGSGLFGGSVGDATAPVISLVTGIPNMIDTTPNFTFTSNEAGTISYTGLCSSTNTSAAVGNNTVTLVALQPGTYTDCALRVEDSSGNLSAELAIGTFSILQNTTDGTPTPTPTPTSTSTSTSTPQNSSNSLSGTQASTPRTFEISQLLTPVNNNTSNNNPFDFAAAAIPPSFTFSENISYIQPQFNSLDEVKYLSLFLNEYQGESLIVDGVFDVEDLNAVNRFQIKYRRAILDVWGLTEPTGFVGLTTRLKINSLLTDQSTQCPVFTEFNGGITGIMESPEIARTQDILISLDLYRGPVNGIWTTETNQALADFQELFSEVMLQPWNLTKGTGYKYKTTNKFLNYLVGCDTGAVELEGVGNFDF